MRLVSICRPLFAALTGLVGLGVGLGADPAQAAQSGVFTSPALTSARLITAEQGVVPGASQLSAGLHLEMAPGWKSYWRSPGEVGLPPEITWDGSVNLNDSQMLWPAPTRFRAFGIENFGYEGAVVMPITLTLTNPGQPVQLRAAVDLLVCSEICVPERFDLTLDLPAAPAGATAAIDLDAAGLIAEFADRVPPEGSATDTLSGMTAGHAGISPDGSALIVTARHMQGFDTPDVFVELGEGATFGPPDIRLSDNGQSLWAALPVLSLDGPAPAMVLTLTDGPLAATFQAVPLSDTLPDPPYVLAEAGGDNMRLLSLVLVALLGGLILNVMPCVLPVLSIKLTSALAARDHAPARIRRGFAASALGVVGFMWVLAAVTLTAQAAGLSVGWGLQFQNPVFLIVMIAILGLFAANMLGLFELTLPQRWNTALANVDGAGRGYLGDFATGAFAAVLATPCSAPFLGTAVAFALAGRAVDVVVIFTALGVGLALPYIAVAIWPSALRILPRPGRWMLAIKAGLGGVLVLTAGWLTWVLLAVAGPLVGLSAVAVLAIGLALFLRGPAKARQVAPAIALIAALILPGVLPAPHPRLTGADETAWVAFDRGDIARRVAAGEVVFVDVTADWCLTCKANKALVLDREPVYGLLNAGMITPMQADWTRPDPEIARFLESYGRFGIPFNIAFGPGAPEGIALTELLSSDAVTDALTRAAGAEIALN